MKKLGILDVKQAILGDKRFRDLFPELKDDFLKILNNPGCACNAEIFKKVLKYKKQLKQYFPNKDIPSAEEAESRSFINYWTVTNCHIDELEKVLNSLHKIGRKQIAVARYEDQVTVIVNDPS